MKRWFLTVILLLLVVACSPSESNTVGTASKSKYISNIGYLYLVEFEGHEYIVYDGMRAGGLCHKVNCKFCIPDGVEDQASLPQEQVLLGKDN
ncbi:MAG: hypothetical protein ACTSUK_08410 [Promethearchaeota archaeon]